VEMVSIFNSFPPFGCLLLCHDNSSSNIFASCKSFVSNPSVNQL
jgi:hypothetical protein